MTEKKEERKERVFCEAKRRKKENSFLWYFLSSQNTLIRIKKVSIHWKSLDIKEDTREDLWLWKPKNLEEHAQDLKAISGMFLIFFWFYICTIHNLLIILIVKIWFSYKNFKNQFHCTYFYYVFSQYYFLAGTVVNQLFSSVETILRIISWSREKSTVEPWMLKKDSYNNLPRENQWHISIFNNKIINLHGWNKTARTTCFNQRVK